MGPPPIHWRPVESQLNWTAAKRAFPAAWLPLIFTAGIVVVPERSGRHRVSQTAGTRPGTHRYCGFLPEIQPGCLFPPGQPLGTAESFYH